MDVHPIELVLPGEPAPVRLMNTTWRDRDGVGESLAEPADLRVFLAEVGRPVPADLDAADVATLHDLRAALHALADPAAEHAAALAAVNAALALAPAPDVLTAGAAGWALGRADGPSFAASVSRLAREGAAVLADRARPLRVCRAPGCGLVFVQHHQRRRWCSVECGNRVRAARYYRRHRGSRDERG
jgi:predicted RNA-binding Zn ribbon-like protein